MFGGVGVDKYLQNSSSFSAEPFQVLFSRKWLTRIAPFIAPLEVPAIMSKKVALLTPSSSLSSP
jgi:hypothetical protein